MRILHCSVRSACWGSAWFTFVYGMSPETDTRSARNSAGSVLALHGGLVLWILFNFFPIGWPQLDAVYDTGLLMRAVKSSTTQPDSGNG